MFQYQYTSEPQNDDDEHRTEKFGHRMRQLLTGIDAHDVTPIGRIDLIKPMVHLFFRTERFHDT